MHVGSSSAVFFIFFISPLTLVKPLPVTERTQLLYKAHRCVPRPHPYTRSTRFFDDTGTSFRFVQPLLLLLLSSLVTTNPISSATELDPSDFLRSRAHGKDSVFLDTDYDILRDFFFFFFYSRLISREILIRGTIKINTIPPIEAYLTRTTEIPIHGPLHRGVEDGLILRCVDKSVSDSL